MDKGCLPGSSATPSGEEEEEHHLMTGLWNVPKKTTISLFGTKQFYSDSICVGLCEEVATVAQLLGSDWTGP